MNTETTTGKWLLKFLKSNVKMSNVYSAVFLRNFIYWANFIFSRFTRLKVNLPALIISKVYLLLLFLVLLFLQLYFFKSLFFVHLKKTNYFENIAFSFFGKGVSYTSFRQMLS